LGEKEPYLEYVAKEIYPLASEEAK